MVEYIKNNPWLDRCRFMLERAALNGEELPERIYSYLRDLDRQGACRSKFRDYAGGKRMNG